jgi:hypothetical protein
VADDRLGEGGADAAEGGADALEGEHADDAEEGGGADVVELGDAGEVEDDAADGAAGDAGEEGGEGDVDAVAVEGADEGEDQGVAGDAQDGGGEAEEELGLGCEAGALGLELGLLGAALADVAVGDEDGELAGDGVEAAAQLAVVPALAGAGAQLQVGADAGFAGEGVAQGGGVLRVDEAGGELVAGAGVAEGPDRGGVAHEGLAGGGVEGDELAEVAQGLDAAALSRVDLVGAEDPGLDEHGEAGGVAGAVGDPDAGGAALGDEGLGALGVEGPAVDRGVAAGVAAAQGVEAGARGLGGGRAAAAFDQGRAAVGVEDREAGEVAPPLGAAIEVDDPHRRLQAIEEGERLRGVDGVHEHERGEHCTRGAWGVKRGTPRTVDRRCGAHDRGGSGVGEVEPVRRDRSGGGQEFDEEGGDVVLAAAGVGVADRGGGGLAEVELEQVDEGVGGVEVGVEAVGAEQQAVADLDGHGEDVDLDVVAQADGAGDHLLAGAALAPGLLGGHGALLDLYVEPGVIFGELGDLAVAGEVDAGVADLTDDDELVGDQDDGGGGAHAALGGVDLAHAVDHVAGVLDGAADEGAEAADGLGGHGEARAGARCGADDAQDAAGLGLGDGGLDDGGLGLHPVPDELDGLLAGDLAAGLAADAVADDEEAESLVGQPGVLVVSATTACVRVAEVARAHRRATITPCVRAR